MGFYPASSMGRARWVTRTGISYALDSLSSQQFVAIARALHAQDLAYEGGNEHPLLEAIRAEEHRRWQIDRDERVQAVVDAVLDPRQIEDPPKRSIKVDGPV